jgi:putative membrane protein
MAQKPRAFRLDRQSAAGTPGDGEPPREGGVVITEEPLEAIEAADGVVVPMERRHGVPWGGMLASALSGLALIAVGFAVERLVADLFAVAPWLGWATLGLAVLALLAFVGIVLRELRGVWRERKIERLRDSAAEALAVRDHEAAKRVVEELDSLYAQRPAAAAARTRLKAIAGEIIDADDRLAIAERELIVPLDLSAKRAIANAARQVSMVTAVSPRAIVDVAFVVYSAVKLLRRLSSIYGGRPGALGFLRLARAAFNHLAVTGGVAVGDSLVQQAVGLGLAARLSAKLGEGVLNGLMTARFGLAALAVCRPLPFVREEPPKIGDVAGELLAKAEAEQP